MHGKDINDVGIMVLFAPCVDENTLAIVHVQHDQFMGMNTIQQLFLSCFPAFYAFYVLLHFLLLVCVLFVLFGHFFLSHE